jgi:hypothetical protein
MPLDSLSAALVRPVDEAINLSGLVMANPTVHQLDVLCRRLGELSKVSIRRFALSRISL